MPADKAYSSKAIRAGLRARGIRATVPLKAGQQAGRRGRHAKDRLPAFDPVAYRDRNAAPEQSPPPTTNATSSTANTITAAAIKIWLRDPVTNDSG